MLKNTLLIVLFLIVCMHCFSQVSISQDAESYEIKIKEKFDEVFKKTLPVNSILENNGIEKLTKKGLDAELEIIDFLSSQFSIQSMERLLESVRTNKKIEKIANRLFKQIEYATNKIKKELKNGGQRNR